MTKDQATDLLNAVRNGDKSATPVEITIALVLTGDIAPSLKPCD